jgi:hypothetical protein
MNLSVRQMYLIALEWGESWIFLASPRLKGRDLVCRSDIDEHDVSTSGPWEES